MAILGTVNSLFDHDPQLRSAPLAIVALGANLPGHHGGPADSVNAAISALQALASSPLVLSDIIETEPEDCPPGSPRFANAVAVFRPLASFDAEGLLTAMQAIEVDFGRRRKGIRNEARVLDLDLISYGDQRLDTASLVLPHPRARQRLFVVEPLAQIWPAYCFPGDARTVSEHLLLLKSRK